MTEYVEEERSNALLKSELRVKDRVAIIGSGNWLDLRGFAVTPRASALSIIIGNNAKKYACFEDTIKMWVYEEMIGDRKLSEIINTEHENVKYPYSPCTDPWGFLTTRISAASVSPRMSLLCRTLWTSFRTPPALFSAFPTRCAPLP